MTNKLNLTWKDVFNSEHSMWMHIEWVLPTVKESGYEYFSWNGRVYNFTAPNNFELSFVDTGIMVDEL